jgi:hypothetical protein
LSIYNALALPDAFALLDPRNVSTFIVAVTQLYKALAMICDHNEQWK